MEITITINGIDDLRRKLNDETLLGPPLRNFWNTLIPRIVRDVQVETPRDTGRLMSSFSPGAPFSVTQIDSSPLPLWGTVGTNVDYAAYVENGTPPHWTSWTNLNEWAYRHNTNVYAVQAAIARRGTRGAHMVMKAAFNLDITLPSYLGKLASDIEAQFGAA